MFSTLMLEAYEQLEYEYLFSWGAWRSSCVFENLYSEFCRKGFFSDARSTNASDPPSLSFRDKLNKIVLDGRDEKRE
eukprot:IDg2880t1